MGIGDMRGKVSAKDIERVRGKRNQPEYAPGFEPEDNSMEFSELFDDLEPLEFGSGTGEKGVSASQIFGIPPRDNKAGGFGEETPGGFGGLGGTHIGGNPFAFGNVNQTQQKAPPKPSSFDKAVDKSEEAMEASGRVLIDLIKSIRKRDVEDMGLYFTNVIKVSVGILVGFMATALVGVFSGIDALSLSKIPLKLLLCGMVSLGIGLVGISTAAIVAYKGKGTHTNRDNDNLDLNPDEEDDDTEIDMGDYDKEFNGLMEELLDDLEVEGVGTERKRSTSSGEEGYGYDTPGNTENINREAMLTREILFRNLRGLFPINTKNFDMRDNIYEESEEFSIIETVALKALAAAGKVEVEDLDSYLDTLVDTLFCYELKLKRVRGLTKLDDISREMTAYFRANSDDNTVSTEVILEGDFYKVTINKGVSAVITVGDVIRSGEAEDYFLDTNNALPVIAGITLNGKPILTDAKFFDTVMIAGKQRSGKSWHVLSFIVTMMAFNTPEDVQFILIDPKSTNLFKNLGLMPHVCGVHGSENILEILREVIEKEGKRRKKLLINNRCDDIWDLRDVKKIKLPVLYIVIDEVMTILAELGGIVQKDFFELLKVIISQLPSLGIRILIVPHRAQGVVDKTVRSLISYTAAIRADNEVICETLDIKKWTTPLINPGDAAVKLQGVGKEFFAKSVALTMSNGRNVELITELARAFYKMGVYIPDMRSVGLGYNRNEEEIREELRKITDGYNVQYDLDSEDPVEGF